MNQVFPAHWDVLPFRLAVKDATSEYSKLQKSEYLGQGRFPIVDQGQQKFGGYTDDESVVSLDGCPAIVFGDHTRIFKFIDEPFCLGADGAKVLEPKAELDKRFLFYYLSSLNIESAGYSRHFKFLKENVVPVPPLPEQKRIAAILDKADAIRRKRQQAIQLADDFLRAVFLDMFGDPVTNPMGWEVKRLGDVIKLSSGNGLSAKEMDSGGCYPVYGGNGINGYHSEYMFEEPQLVIGRVGAYCGAIHITQPCAWVTDNALYIREYVQDVNVHYMAQLLDVSNLNQYAGKAAQPLVSGGRIYPLEMIFPPLQDQFKFEAIKTKYLESSKIVYSALLEIETMFGSLTQKAFSGQL
ncbi:restriction endonuclease subunit S [Pseudomonas citronellolis]|uniref:restriction endonuclease subunit S n=1 Tax=Pseudomonas citronellolis TaxID=53408 RepID=UPI00077897B7|nr:restriction endonuclease subunit S [Pseudomonas citronellolis]AMO73919.1 Type I restriction modification DNA specificity domain protein [Pseudomonas citronellolis]